MFDSSSILTFEKKALNLREDILFQTLSKGHFSQKKDVFSSDRVNRNRNRESGAYEILRL